MKNTVMLNNGVQMPKIGFGVFRRNVRKLFCRQFRAAIA